MIDVNKLKELISLGYSQREMANILGVTFSAVKDRVRRNGLSVPNHHNQLKFDNTVFDKIDTEEKAYWLGFLYADGAVSKTDNNVELSLCAKDSDHLQKFKKFLKTPREVKISQIKLKDKIYYRCRLSVTDKHFKNRLCECGCTSQKSQTIVFPSEEILPKSLYIPFVRGYSDGDGCVCFTDKTAHFSIIGTKEFLTKICEIFPEFNGLHKDKRWKGNTYYIEVNTKKAAKVLSLLYTNSNIYLQRKYEKACRFIEKLMK